MRNHKFGPHHIDFSFLQQLPFLFFLHDVTNSPIARSYVRRKSQVVPKIQGAAGSGASRRPKFIFFFYFFIFGGLGAPFAPGANPVVVMALITRNFSPYFSFHTLS